MIVSLLNLTHAVSERSGEKVNSTDFLRFRNQKTVRLDAYWNRKIYETLVSFVNSARYGTQNDLIVSEKIQDFRWNVGGQQMNFLRHLHR